MQPRTGTALRLEKAEDAHIWRGNGRGRKSQTGGIEMASIDEDLQILDEQTFLAEAKGSIEGKAWNEYLRDVLAEDFRLRRSRAGTPLEGRDEMIQRIAEGPSATRTRLETKTWIDARLGVVVSSVATALRMSKCSNEGLTSSGAAPIGR
jgi:hypothetical protein